MLFPAIFPGSSQGRLLDHETWIYYREFPRKSFQFIFPLWFIYYLLTGSFSTGEQIRFSKVHKKVARRWLQSSGGNQVMHLNDYFFEQGLMLHMLRQVFKHFSPSDIVLPLFQQSTSLGFCGDLPPSKCLRYSSLNQIKYSITIICASV